MERHFKYRKKYFVTFAHRTTSGKFNLHVMVTQVSGKFLTLSFDLSKPSYYIFLLKPRTFHTQNFYINESNGRLLAFKVDSPQISV